MSATAEAVVSKPPVAPPSREEIAAKIRVNQPLTKAEVMVWMGWTPTQFSRATTKWRNDNHLIYENRRVLPSELTRYISGRPH